VRKLEILAACTASPRQFLAKAALPREMAAADVAHAVPCSAVHPSCRAAAPRVRQVPTGSLGNGQAEEQVILRLPKDAADQLRALMRQRAAVGRDDMPVAFAMGEVGRALR
jgi:hypothetical protein